MKCTGKLKTGVLALAAVSLLAAGCGKKTYELDQPYDVYRTQIHYQAPGDPEETTQQTDRQLAFFARDLCVTEDVSTGKGTERTDRAEAAGVFHLEDHTVTYARNIYKKLYPASTTKILTAYIALKHGNLSDVVTVSAAAADQLSDSSVCDVHAGDKITLEDLLYGLMLKSGNDAADAIAEHISGDEQKFVELMNQEAAALGATHSHFVNPHGLQDENHYTCVYDLYLMFQAALQYEEFEKIISTKEYNVTYQDASGLTVTQAWPASNLFLTGEFSPPGKVTVIGGKTGTTNDAGYCLVLYSRHKKKGPLISIVLKADSRDSLYEAMTDLMKR